jgi:hypothetical protein
MRHVLDTCLTRVEYVHTCYNHLLHTGQHLAPGKLQQNASIDFIFSAGGNVLEPEELKP